MGLDDVETQTAAPPAAARRALPVLNRGTIVGRYVILDRLGIGGMGVVYRAYDPDLDRRVALKLVRTVSDEATVRLIREAQALAKVSHPNIVQIFDVGVFSQRWSANRTTAPNGGIARARLRHDARLT